MSPVTKILKIHGLWQETAFMLMKDGSIQCGHYVIML